MPVYDHGQINRMRQDAVRRSREMHGSSVVSSSHYSQGQNKSDLPPVPPETELQGQISDSDNKNHSYEQKNKTNQIKDILNKLLDGKIDSDKLIIIALMVILAKEGADMKLILALGYILL